MSTPEAANYSQDITTDLNRIRGLDRFDSSAGFDEPIAEMTDDYGQSLAEMDKNPEAIHDVFSQMDADEKLIRMAIRQRQGFRSAWNTARDAWVNTPGPQNIPVPGGAVPGAPAVPAPYPPAPVGPPPFPGMPAVAPLAGPGFINRLRQIGATAQQVIAPVQWGVERAEQSVRNLAREGNAFYGTYDVIKESWVTKVVLSAGVRAVAGTALHAAGVAGGPLGAISAAIPGGIWGYIRGKNQTESAAAWMSELDILKMNTAQLNQFTEGQIERTLGIIKNAVDEGRIRGNPEQKIELATKYRLMRCRLIALRNEANTRGDELNPVLERVDTALTSENEVAEQLTRMAGKKYEAEFKEIMQLKKNKVLMSMIKGAVVAGTIGGLLGFINEHGGPHGTIEWIHDKLHGIKGDFTGGNHEITGSVQHALEAKKDVLEHSANIHQEALQNQSSLNEMRDLHSAVSNGGDINLSPDQLNALNHYEHIQNLSQAGQDASVQGFGHHLVSDIRIFDGLLHNSNLHDMTQMASVHNLDLHTVMPGGEQFGNYLVDNKEAFLQFPPDIQSFILSHPSVAPEFMNVVASGSEYTLKAIVDRYSVVLGAAALGGSIGLFVHAHRGQKEADKKIQDANYEGFQAVNAEMRSSGSNPVERRQAAAATQRNQEQERATRIEANRQRAIEILTGAESVTFTGGPRLADLAGLDLHVDRVDTNAAGRATIMSLRPINPPAAAGRNINGVDVNDYIDDDGNLRMNLLTLRNQEAVQVEANRQRAIQTLTNAESVTFNGGTRDADLRGILLHVENVNTDAAGRVSTMVLNPINPPIPRGRDINNVDVNEYLDDDGNLRMDRITIRSQETIQREYERFLNQPILGRFAGGIFIPDAARAAALNLPPNMRMGVRLEGHTVWPIGLNINLRLTSLRTPVVQNPVYSADAEYQLGNVGNYIYREGFRVARDTAKINQIQELLSAGGVGAGMAQLIYMGRSFFSVESVANNNTDVVLQQFDINGNQVNATINTTRRRLENTELYIFDQV